MNKILSRPNGAFDIQYYYVFEQRISPTTGREAFVIILHESQKDSRCEIIKKDCNILRLKPINS